MIFSTYDLKDQYDMNTVQVQIQNMLTRQISSAEDLKIDCQKIKEDVEIAVNTLSKIEEHKYNKISNESGIIEKVNQLKFKIEAELENYKVTPLAKVKKIDYIIRLSKKAIKAKLKNEIMKKIRIPLEKAIAELNYILEVSKVVDPLLAKISSNENKMNEYVLNMRYFAAINLLPEIEKDCNTSINSITNSSYPKKYLSSSLTRIQTLCKASSSHYEDLKSLSMQPHDFVYNYSKLVSANIKINCSSVENSIVCNKIAYLNSIDSEKFKEIPLEKLNYIEKEWADIYERFKMDM